MSTPALRLYPTAYQGGYRQSSHSHDDLHLSMVLRGHVAESVGSDTVYGSALSVSAKDPTLVHANEFGPNGAVLVRLSIIGRGLASLVDDSRRVTEWRWTHDAAVAAPFLRIIERGLQGAADFAVHDDDVVDLVAAMTASSMRVPRGAPPLWLHSAVSQMRDDWSPTLTVRDVARTAGVHPVYLARCVRRWYGVAAGDLLRQARLLHTADVLARAERTVSVAAHAAGFADESHLCRDFARGTGMTPGRFRRLVHGVELGGLRRKAATRPVGS